MSIWLSYHMTSLGKQHYSQGEWISWTGLRHSKVGPGVISDKGLGYCGRILMAGISCVQVCLLLAMRFAIYLRSASGVCMSFVCRLWRNINMCSLTYYRADWETTLRDVYQLSLVTDRCPEPGIQVASATSRYRWSLLGPCPGDGYRMPTTCRLVMARWSTSHWPKEGGTYIQCHHIKVQQKRHSGVYDPILSISR